VLLALFAVDLFAAEAGLRQELRHRLDSLEVETQVRKRQGKPIADLESAVAALRDSLSEMREAVPPGAGASLTETGEKAGFLKSLTAVAPFLEEALAFKPRGMFDWVIVGTGLVALLSGLVLVIGLIVGRKKRPAGPRKVIVGRKVNLAPTRSQPAVNDADEDVLPSRPGALPAAGPAGATYNSGGRMDRAAANSAPPAQEHNMVNFQAMMDKLREVAPPPPPPPSAPVSRPAPAQNPVPQPPAPPPPPPPPPSLIIDAPDEPEPVRHPAGREFTGGNINDRIADAAASGMSEQEISRRFQIGIDQVRLILRMMNK